MAKVEEKLLLILVVLVLMTAPAIADGPVNVDNDLGFGSFVDTMSSSSTGPIFTLSIEATVWFDSSTGTYTYVYEFTDNGTSIFGISSLTIDTGFFDANLHWGIIGTPVPFSATFGGTLTFHFPPSLPSGSTASGSTTTVYAQSTEAPLQYHFWGTGFGGSGSDQYTLGPDPPPPIYVAEAPSLLLLSTGLLSVFGIGFFRKFS